MEPEKTREASFEDGSSQNNPDLLLPKLHAESSLQPITAEEKIKKDNEAATADAEIYNLELEVQHLTCIIERMEADLRSNREVLSIRKSMLAKLVEKRNALTERFAVATPSDKREKTEQEKVMEAMDERTNNLLLQALIDAGTDYDNDEYLLRIIPWRDNFIMIVTQSQNGPCPLIAIANILLLRGSFSLPYSQKVITSKHLIEQISKCMKNCVLKNTLHRDQYEQMMYDAIVILPRLLKGLVVNVRFTGVRDFERTAESIVFDALDIPLYHGWLVDPQAEDIAEAVGTQGYNQLVELIVSSKSSEDSELMTRALIAQNFLESTSTQLTYHGLCELNSTMALGEIAIMFRNNHFSCIFKRSMDIAGHSSVDSSADIPYQLFQLVTDQGLILTTSAVWETLNNIEGDSTWVDGYFVDHLQKPQYQPTSHNITDVRSVSTDEQVIQDFLVALSLQEDQAAEQQTSESWEGFEDVGSHPDMVSMDLELARRLQETYQRDLRAASPGSPYNPHLRSPDRNKKGPGCTIL